MQAEVFSSIKEISPSLWNQLISAEETFLTHQYLRMVEESSPADYEFWYVVIREQDRVVAQLPLFAMSLDLDMMADQATKKVIRGFRRVFKNFLVIRPLIGGSPPSVGNHCIVIDPTANQQQVLTLLVQTVEQIARQNRISLVGLKEFDPDQAEKLGWFTSLGYLKVPSLPTNKLYLVGNNFEDYLRSVRCHYRQSIKASLRKLEREKVEVRVLHDFGATYGDDYYRLYEDVLEKAPIRFEKLTAEYFRGTGNSLGERAALVALYKDDTLLGYFLVCVSSTTSISAMFAGIDYERNRQYDTYFNLFYQVIRLAYSLDKKVVEFGQNSYELKARLGCQQIPLFLYLKHLNKAWHLVISLLGPLLFPSYQAKGKNVFRTHPIRPIP